MEKGVAVDGEGEAGDGKWRDKRWGKEGVGMRKGGVGWEREKDKKEWKGVRKRH